MEHGFILKKINLTMKQKLTVTIGIPAHNEARNIANLLESVLLQNNKFYLLESIVVVCDGCTDETAKIAGQYLKNDKRIKLLDDGKRLGKATRLNQLFTISRSEILILLDADIVLNDTEVINEIVQEFNNNKIALVGGHDIPNPAKGFIAKIIIEGINLWSEVRKEIKAKDCIHKVHGNIYAVHEKLYKKISFPKKIVNDDMFIYLKARELGFKSSFAEKAVIYYQAPDNLTDFYKQAGRFFTGRYQINEYFGKKVLKYFKVLRSSKIRGTLNLLRINPLYAPLAIILQLSVRWVIPLVDTQYDNRGIWRQIDSTKKAMKI